MTAFQLVETVPTSPDPQIAPARPSYGAIVLGAGPAGLSAAKLLTDAGHKVLVIDQASQIGGTHRSRNISDYTFDVGSIFYEDNARLFEQFPNTRDLCPPVVRVQRRIAPDGQVLHYPIEPRDVLGWPRLRLARAVGDLLWARLTTQRDGTVDAAVRARLGTTIYVHSGLENYITRMHSTPPSAIDEEFFFRRMRFLEQKTEFAALMSMLWRARRRKSVRRGAPAALRVRPASGFATLFAPIGDHLRARGTSFELAAPVSRITRGPDGFVVAAGGRTFSADAVVGAMPLDLTHRAVFGTPSGLQSLDLMTLFVSVGKLEARLGNVLFNYHGQGRWKRATIYSRIYPELAMGREFLSVEVTLPSGAAADPDAAFADFRDHMSRLGLGSPDMTLEGFELVKDAYPLYLKGKADVAALVLERLTNFGILSVGRQGRFEYLPTSSGVLRRVEQELNENITATTEASP